MNDKAQVALGSLCVVLAWIGASIAGDAHTEPGPSGPG